MGRLALVGLLMASSGGLAGCLAGASGLEPLEEVVSAPDWQPGDTWAWQVETTRGDGRGAEAVDRDRTLRTMTVLQTDVEVAWDIGHWVRLDDGRGERLLFIDARSHQWQGQLRTQIGQQVFETPAYVHLPPAPTSDLRFPLQGGDPLVLEHEGPGDPFRAVAHVRGRETLETAVGTFETVRIERETTVTHRVGDLDVPSVRVERLWYAPAVGAVVRSEGVEDVPAGYSSTPVGAGTEQVRREVRAWTMQLVAMERGDGEPRSVGPYDDARPDLLLSDIAEQEARLHAWRTDPQRIGYDPVPGLVLDPPLRTMNLSDAAHGIHMGLHESDDGAAGRAVAQPWPVRWTVTRTGSDAVLVDASYNGTSFRFTPAGPDRYTIEAVAEVPRNDGTRAAVSATAIVNVTWQADATHAVERGEAPGVVDLLALPSLAGSVLDVTDFRLDADTLLPDSGRLYVANASAAQPIDRDAPHAFEDDSEHVLQWRYAGPDLLAADAPVTTGHRVSVDVAIGAQPPAE